MFKHSLSAVILAIMGAFPAYAEICENINKKYELTHRLHETRHESLASMRATAKSKLIHLEGQTVGWLDFSKMIQEIDTVTVCVNTAEETVVGSGTRDGAVYFTEEKVVVLNLKTIEQYTEENTGLKDWSLIFLHEFLGALGYPDKNYEITSYAFATSQGDEFSPKRVEQLRKALLNFSVENSLIQENVRFSESGGISGVGGGGDPEVAALKAQAAVRLAASHVLERFHCGASKKKEVMEFFLGLRIETDAVVHYENRSLHFDSFYIVRNGDESFLQIKTQEWNRINQLGPQAVKEGRKYIKNLLRTSCMMFKEAKASGTSPDA